MRYTLLAGGSEHLPRWPVARSSSSDSRQASVDVVARYCCVVLVPGMVVGGCVCFGGEMIDAMGLIQVFG